MTAEASPFRWFDGHTKAFLEQAGCGVDLLRLWDEGVRGNAHGMMLELNNAAVLDVILAHVREVTGGRAARRSWRAGPRSPRSPTL